MNEVEKKIQQSANELKNALEGTRHAPKLLCATKNKTKKSCK